MSLPKLMVALMGIALPAGCGTQDSVRRSTTAFPRVTAALRQACNSSLQGQVSDAQIDALLTIFEEFRSTGATKSDALALAGQQCAGRALAGECAVCTIAIVNQLWP